jgi:kynurenine formamidase
MARRWTRRPEGSNWGEFGEDDQLGSLNHITAERVLDAVRTVEHGLAFCLSLPLDYPGGNGLVPHRLPPVLEPTVRQGKPYFNCPYSEVEPHYCDGGSDDRVTLSTQYSTQWDSFAHVGYAFDADGSGSHELCYYNGFRAGSDIIAPDARPDGYRMPLGIDTFAARPIQGRGVMVDIERHFGRDGRTLSFADLQAVLDAQAVTVEPGDILCLHTGYADEVLKMNRKPDPVRLHAMCAALDGRDGDLLAWISETRIAAIAADNYAVERVGLPATDDATKLLPLHHHCLFKRGVPLGELWHLSELAAWLQANGRQHFLLTAPPLRLPGAVGSPVTPVATV